MIDTVFMNSLCLCGYCGLCVGEEQWRRLTLNMWRSSSGLTLCACLILSFLNSFNFPTLFRVPRSISLLGYFFFTAVAAAAAANSFNQ